MKRVWTEGLLKYKNDSYLSSDSGIKMLKLSDSYQNKKNKCIIN